MLQHNGKEIFDGIEILSLEGIIEYNEVQDFPEGYVLIGYHYDGRYVIDRNKSRNGLGYMLYLDSIDDIDDAVNLDSNFEIWLTCSSLLMGRNIGKNNQKYDKMASEKEDSE